MRSSRNIYIYILPIIKCAVVDAIALSNFAQIIYSMILMNLKLNVKGIDTNGKVLSCFYEGENICDFSAFFIFLSEEKVYLKKKKTKSFFSPLD